MYKKKIISILLISASLFLFSSCSTETLRTALRTGSGDKRADERVEQIVAAIKGEDREAIKALFSEHSLEEVEDIEAEMDHLFDFFEGEIVSWGREGYRSSGRTEYGKRTQLLWYDIIIKTDKEEFSIYVPDFSINTRHPEKAGIYMLEIHKGEWNYDWAAEERMKAGIHEPMLVRSIEPGDDIPKSIAGSFRAPA